MQIFNGDSVCAHASAVAVGDPRQLRIVTTPCMVGDSTVLIVFDAVRYDLVMFRVDAAKCALTVGNSMQCLTCIDRCNHPLSPCSPARPSTCG